MKLILFVLSGCSAPRIGAYGNEWVATPSIDRLAAEGIVFDRHYAEVPETAAALHAWFAGEHPALRHPAAPENADRLLDLLSRAGVPRFLIRAQRAQHALPVAHPQAWSEIIDIAPIPGIGQRSSQVLKRLPGLLQSWAELPSYFLVIALDRLLPPWEIPQDVFEVYLEEYAEGEPAEGALPEPWKHPPTGLLAGEGDAGWEWLHRSFAAAMTTFDADFGGILDLLRDADLHTQGPWILTADAGFPLGEHGIVGPHRPWLHEEAVHLPLIMRLPEADHAGLRVPALTQPVDLFPTILGWFQQEIPENAGFDLRAHFTEIVETRPYAFSRWSLAKNEEVALRTQEWTYLKPIRQASEDARPRLPLLYRYPEDRWEMNDLATRSIETVEELDGLIKSLLPDQQ